MNIEQWAERAEQAIQCHEDEGRLYARFAGQEMDYEVQRTVLKSQIIERLMGTTNELTSKPHSASSAEEAARVHPDYLSHMNLLGDTVVAKNNSCTAMYSARLRASLAIALIRTEIGVGA